MISTTLNLMQSVWNPLIPLSENKFLSPIAEQVEGDVRGPNPVQGESNAANKWPESTLLPG
jgi:hypothetical protein